MSLQPGINPLDRRMSPVYGPGPGQHYSFPTAEEIRKRMGPGFKTMEYVPGRDKSIPRTLEYIPERDKSEIQLLGGSPVYGPGPGEIDRYKTPTAPGMGPGMAMTGGFDASDLMTTPGMRQQSTRDQAEKVSAPYMEANRKAAGKTNPMNATSQEPGRTFLMDYIGE